MRLNRLILTRYGKFTDYVIDFGDATPGRPDLHMVYGPNEAGKTTVLSGFLDLLFGIEMRSRFNFLHAYETMRIGACLEQDGQRQHVMRVKRQQNTLLDGKDEQPVSERLIGAQLGGIDRDSYRAMFSLDDDTIEKGGESILASKGDLGQLLFAAAAGLSDLSYTLTKLHAEADKFYRPSSRFGELADLKSEIAKRKEERHRLDMVASEFRQMTDARDRALEFYRAARDERAAVQSRMVEIQGYLRALPQLRDLRALREQLAPLAHLPEAPTGWADEVERLQRTETELDVKLQHLRVEIARRQADLAAVIVDDAALALAERIGGWETAYGRAWAEIQDIPLLRREIMVEDAAIAATLRRVGRADQTDPRAFLLGAASVTALRELIERRSGIEASLERARTERTHAERRLAAALEQLEREAPTDEADTSVIAAVVQSLARDDHEFRRRAAERSREDTLAALADRLAELRPWESDIEELAAMQPPEEAILHGWKSDLAAAERRVAQHEQAEARLRDERVPLDAQRQAIANAAGVVSDGEAADIRTAREEAWASHRRTLDPHSAGVFEAALRRDDIVTDARLRHEKDISRLQQVIEKLAILDAEHRLELERLVRARATLASVRDTVKAGLDPRLPADLSIELLEAWLRKRDRALETRARLKQIEADLRQADRDSVLARTKLSNVLTAAGLHHDPASDIGILLAIGHAAVARDARLRGLRSDIEQRRREFEVRDEEATAALRAEASWLTAWTEACGACWLRELGAAPPVAAVREILDACIDLAPALGRRDGLLVRIDDMLENQRNFAAEVGAVARMLDPPSPAEDTLALAATLIRRVQDALRAKEMHADKTRELGKALADQNDLTEARRHHDKRRTAMADFFAVTGLDEVAEKLRLIERKTDWQSKAAAIERQIVDDLRAPSITEAEALLDRADRAALETELNDLMARFEEHDLRVQRFYADHRRAHELVESVDGDATVARLEEERRTLLLHIEDGAQRYLRLRLGIAAAEHGLRLYRRRHQSSMMERASKAFRTITRGAYSGLTSQPDREREILVALASDGSSREADKLSKGTRFQLYLALRVAGYHEFARQRHPVPFIADDIMETFDDFRAEEAIGLFAEMAAVGQVIYLTHHRHLCEIARKVCPDVHLHDLSANAA